MRKMTMLFAAAALAVFLMASEAVASAPPPTDGTETYEPGCAPIPEDQGGGELCWGEDGFGPPQLIRVELERCVVVVDPPHWVWVTAHVLDGPDHLTVVFPYEYTRPGEIDFDLGPYTGHDSRVDDVWFTWNIGSGQSAHTGPIDCDPDHPDPPDGGYEPTTTTTTVPATVPTAPPTPTTVRLSPPVTLADVPQAPTLPATGSDGLLAWAGLGALAGGVAALAFAPRDRGKS